MGKILPEAQQIVIDFQPDQRAKAAQLRTALSKQLTLLEPLDKDSLQFMEDDDEVDETAMADKIEKSYKLRSDMKAAITMIDELLPQIVTVAVSEASDLNSIVEEDVEQQSTASRAAIASRPTHSQPPSQGHSVRAKLPKLKVKKSNGKIEEWQEFWDGFESAIHRNECLSKVDKFNDLRTLLTGQAKSVITGFSLTTNRQFSF